LKQLGLLGTSEIELPEVGASLSPARWRDINTMTISFGHGIAVSPIQMAEAVAVLVNGGVRYPATLLKRSHVHMARGQQVLSRKTSRQMRKLMRMVVANGTGRKAAVPGYRVGGKTGTAEKQVGGRYKRKSLISSFVGAFPLDNPRYVILVLVDEPKGNERTQNYATGGWVAAPVVRRVIERMGPALGMLPVHEQKAPQRAPTKLFSVTKASVSIRERRIATR
ncbi:MAG: penicillin-binding transpeptidase domain-containing protein, partial [Rhodospirillales bacterium]